MTELLKDSVAVQATELLNYYSFDLGDYTAAELIHGWLMNYSANWILTAVIEALYQGRYKGISVEQILALWTRRGHPIHHFNHEFERIICGKFSQIRHVSGYSLLEETPSRPASAIAPSEVSDTQPTRILEQSQNSTDSLEQDIQDFLNDSATAIDGVATEPSIDANEVGDRSFADTSDLPLSQSTNNLSSLVEPRSVDLPIQPFKPAPELEATPVERMGWSRVEAAKYPIHQFVPTLNSPEFHTKLKAVARQGEAIGTML